MGSKRTRDLKRETMMRNFDFENYIIKLMLAKRPLASTCITDFFKRPATSLVSTASASISNAASLEESKEPKKKRESKKNVNLYELPRSFHKPHEGKFKNGKVSIWHWNINGINSVLTKGAFQGFLDQEDPDIVCLNEIKIDDEKLEKTKLRSYLPKRYHQYWNCSKARKGYAGTAILTKEEPLRV